MVTRRGFALVEIVIASAILGFAVSAILGLMMRAVAAQADGERIEAAARLADERLNLVLATGPEGYQSVFPLEGACEEPFEDYRYLVTIDPRGGGEPYDVRCRIEWRSAARTRSLTLHTLISPRAGEEPDPLRQPEETLSREAR